MGPNGEYGSERVVEGAAARQLYHNDSKSREMLPVWNGPNGEYGSERPVEGAAARQLYHNGSKSRETLPVWNGAEWRIRLREACRRGHCETDLPQRQQIAGNAAGVVR